MTVLELLLNYLPERYVDAVVSNIKDKSSLENKSGTISSELMTLFDWKESREGYEFWEELLECLMTNKNLPELPITIIYIPSTTFVCKKTIYVMNAADTNINLAFDFNKDQLKEMDLYKKEKILAFMN
jgi:hypothetical protein